MRSNHLNILLVCGASLALLGCHPKTASGPASKKSATAVYRLFDLFQPEDLSGKVSPEDAGWKRVEWRADEMAPWTPPPSEPGKTNEVKTPPPVLGFQPLGDLTSLAVGQGRLAGEGTGPAPLLHFALRENRGGAENVKFVEVKMTVSGAKQAWLRPERGYAMDEAAVKAWAVQTNSWDASVDIEDNKVQTYRFEIKADRGRQGNPPPAGPGGMGGPGPGGSPTTDRPRLPEPRDGDLRHFFLTFRDAKSAKFAIESVRFVSEREEKLKDPSGQQWAGLAEIYHATLAAKTPEIFRMPLRELPEKAALQLAIGTREDSPVKFTISISPRDAGKEAGPTRLFERTVTIPNRWQSVRLDLSAYAGKSVLLELAVAGEKKGLWGYWGSPIIRSHASDGVGVANGPGGKPRPRGVIFMVIDTLRKDHLNIYGYPRETTVYLKKFAEEGVAFNHAISQGTMTKISVPSMVTSLYPMSHTVLGFDKGLPASAKTIAEVFRDEGYSTVAYSSVPFTGKMNNMHQGYDELHEKASISDSEYDAKTARHYVDRLIPWLEEHHDEPFFVFLHLFDPHSPFRPRPPYDTMWGAANAKDRLAELEEDMRREKVPLSMGLPGKTDYQKTGNNPEELLKIYQDWYDGSIRGVDAEVGRLLEALRDMGLEKDTLFVWGTDHGEEFWEHGRLFHGHSVYGELNQVPLVFHWPNNPDIRKGVMIQQQVQNIDIMPTILELTGITGPTNMQGRSLLPLLNGTGVANWEDRPAITQAMVGPPPGSPEPRKDKPHFGIIDHGWKLIRKEVDPTAQEELYEHPADYLNLTNVFPLPDSAARVKTLEETLESWKKMAHAAELPSDDTMAQQVSSEELRRLRALGYVGGAPAAKAPASAATNAPPAAGTSTNK